MPDHRTHRVSVRPATPADAALVHALTQAAFESLRGRITPPSSAHDETVDAVAAAIEAGGAAVADLDGEPVGALRLEPRDGYLYVGRVAVVPAARGRGVARALMAYAERHAAALGLPETRVDVRRALPGNLATFEALGYRVVAEYAHPRDPSIAVATLAKPVTPDPGGPTDA